MNDLISRADAIRIIDGIDTWQAGWRDNAIESMKALSSAQPEQHWIPAIVTPDSDRRVLCLTKTKKGVLNYVLGYYAHDRKYWVCGMNSNVIAWMDLPEPPEEEHT